MADQRIILNVGGHEFVLAKRIGHDWIFCMNDKVVFDGNRLDLGEILNEFRYPEINGQPAEMYLLMYYEHERTPMVDPILRTEVDNK